MAFILDKTTEDWEKQIGINARNAVIIVKDRKCHDENLQSSGIKKKSG